MEDFVAIGLLTDPYWTYLKDEKTGETFDELLANIWVKHVKRPVQVRITVEVLE